MGDLGDRVAQPASAQEEAIAVNVTSAVVLDDTQVDRLTRMLASKLGAGIELSLKVDQTVIGGLSIHSDRMFIDYTVRKRLIDMKGRIRRGMFDDSKA